MTGFRERQAALLPPGPSFRPTHKRTSTSSLGLKGDEGDYPEPLRCKLYLECARHVTLTLP